MSWTIRRSRNGLEYIGYKRLGLFAAYHYFRCILCQTDYPELDGGISCNGRVIERCPYCEVKR